MRDLLLGGGMTREQMVAAAAYHIDKTCTGGTSEDFVAAELIVEELVDPLIRVLRALWEAADIDAIDAPGWMDAVVEAGWLLYEIGELNSKEA
jgi:hypothetical protein